MDDKSRQGLKIKTLLCVFISMNIPKTNLVHFFEVSEMRAIIPGTDGSEHLGTLLQLF